MAEGATPRLPHGNGASAERAPQSVDGESVREALRRVLSSHEFRTSKRSQDFLRYVVENTLNGRADILKERTIGIEVFGRATSYDPSEDATVRVKAGEVRKRLGLYYATEGAKDRVRIELPAGTYVPEFRLVNTAPTEDVPPGERVAPLPPTPGPPPVLKEGEEGRPPPARSSGLRAAMLPAIVLLAAGGLLGWWLHGPSSTPTLDGFWSSAYRAASPVTVCAAFVPVYAPENDLHPDANSRPKQFVLLTDQFVGGGDLVAVSRVAGMLASQKRRYAVRIGNDVSFHDLQTGPAVLIGYSYTRWQEISSQMRFVIDTWRRPVGITDNGKPTPWVLPNLPADRRSSEDYAIVSRVFHPATHETLVELAGITQYGTEAASDLVTHEDLLADALRSAPPGWQKKNLQLVLHVKVIAGSPGAPHVLATYFW